MKRLFVQAILLLMPLMLLSDANEAQDAVDALLGTVDLSEWDAWFAAEAPEIPFRPSEFVRSIASAEDPFDSDSLKDRAKKMLLPSVGSAAAKLILFVGLGVFGSVLNGVRLSESTSEAAQTAFRIATACIALAAVFTEISVVYRMLARTAALSERVLPVILGFLILGGMEHTAGALTPAFALLSNGVIRLLKTVVIPLGCIGGVLTVTDACASGRLASLGKLFLRAAKWMLAGICSVYVLLSTIRGAAAASADGLMIRTAKLAAGSLPAVGGVVSDSVETAYQCLIFVKNALGIGCAALILLVFAKPVIDVFLTRSALRASSAITEPLAGKPYADGLRGLGDTLHLFMLAEFATVAMALTALAPVFAIGRAL